MLSNPPEVQQKQRTFVNGDRYSGGWTNGLPEGEGRYDWVDGSSYEGGWKSGVKEGVGCYQWASGARYDGEWRGGCMHGVGRFSSHDGSTYQGGWCNDLKHGLGRKVYANGDVYEGLWAAGKADGPGRYQWHDGNEYDGEWRAGRMHGQGTFVWAGGERFDGEWKDGAEDGVGVFTFADGSTYEGFWRGSRKHGAGILRPPPPAPAAGSSSSGHRHMRSSSTLPSAVANSSSSQLRPSNNKAAARSISSGGTRTQQQQQQQQHSAAATGSGPPVSAFAQAAAAAGGAGSAQLEHRSPASTDGPMRAPSAAADSSSHPAGGTADASGHTQLQQQAPDTVIIKEYRDGKLLQQFAMPAAAFAAICSSFQAGPDRPAAAAAAGQTAAAVAAAGGRPARTGSTVGRSAGSVVSGRAGKRQVVTPLGEVVYREHSAYDLMLQLQLGIRWSVVRGSNLAATSQDGPSSQQPSPQQQQLRPSQFVATIKQPFPRDGSSSTPVHPAKDFEWKDYAPAAFKLLRELSGVAQADYISHLCGDQALRLLASPGKSGAMFFLSTGERFMVKTVTKAEGKLLRQLLPRYVDHMSRHPNSLLTRLYGLHRVQAGQGRGRKVRFVVMGNIFCTGLTIHVRYDLKGSTKGRTAGPEAAHPGVTTVLKDCDLTQSFRLEEGWAERLQQQLAADASLLQAARIMDYSLLLGVHFRGGVGHDKIAAGVAAVSNFVEHTPDVDLHAALSRLQDQLSRLQLDPGLPPLLLELGRANMLAAGAGSNPGRHRHRHSSMTRTPTLVLATRPKRAASSGRPLALAPGATDDIARSLGQSRVTLGLNMAATAVQLPGPVVLQAQQRGQQGQQQQQQQGTTQDVVLYFGIIDILQAYTVRKKLESGARRLTARSAAAISAVAPAFYAARFRSLMARVFT